MTKNVSAAEPEREAPAGRKVEAKPVDRWLGVAALVVGVILFLAPKTPPFVISLLFVCFALLVHPIWNFWWIERSLLRRLLMLSLVAILLAAVGSAALPELPTVVGLWRNYRTPPTAGTVTCVAATQPGLTGGVVSGSTSCSIPPSVVISGAILEYTLNDGGEVQVDGQLVFAVPPDAGTDTGTVVLPKRVFTPSSSFTVRVVARNAMNVNGEFSGDVYGIASVRVSTLSRTLE